jgi:hypothetical protein
VWHGSTLIFNFIALTRQNGVLVARGSGVVFAEFTVADFQLCPPLCNGDDRVLFPSLPLITVYIISPIFTFVNNFLKKDKNNAVDKNAKMWYP